MNNRLFFATKTVVPAVNNPANTSFLCGVEHEIEDLTENWFDICGEEFDDEPFHVDEDGSLQSGREFITHPDTAARQVALHKQLHSSGMFGPDRFSERTSIHVHVNMLYANREQTLSLLTAYCLLEPLFFAFVGQQREQNIHCVPLWATAMPNLIYKNTLDTYRKLPMAWHKYTALNVKPLDEIGTIEFRHLEGTDNNIQFANWLYLIKALYDWAMADNGKFVEQLPILLQRGYNAWQQEFLSWDSVLTRYLHKLLPYANQERLVDVFLLAATRTLPGLSNPKQYLKA